MKTIAVFAFVVLFIGITLGVSEKRELVMATQLRAPRHYPLLDVIRSIREAGSSSSGSSASTGGAGAPAGSGGSASASSSSSANGAGKK